MGDEEVREQGRWEDAGAEEMGGCRSSEGDGRLQKQGRWEGLGAGEIGGCGSRVD